MLADDLSPGGLVGVSVELQGDEFEEPVGALHLGRDRFGPHIGMSMLLQRATDTQNLAPDRITETVR